MLSLWVRMGLNLLDFLCRHLWVFARAWARDSDNDLTRLSYTSGHSGYPNWSYYLTLYPPFTLDSPPQLYRTPAGNAFHTRTQTNNTITMTIIISIISTKPVQHETEIEQLYAYFSSYLSIYNSYYLHLERETLPNSKRKNIFHLDKPSLSYRARRVRRTAMA